MLNLIHCHNLLEIYLTPYQKPKAIHHTPIILNMPATYNSMY